jgi:type II secretory pathway pseudopilin PulG
MTSRKTGFTIVELLTVMSIIIILMSVLVPGLTRTRRYAKVLAQKAQFHEITKGLELFRNDHQETYPDSGAADSNGDGYCGAMKLCEALLGQDGMGFHPSSSFQSKTSLYLFNLCTQINPADYTDTLRTNLRERTKYIDSDNIKAARLKDLYSWYDTASTGKSYYKSASFKTTVDAAPPSPTEYPNSVITDLFLKASSRCNGKKIGMPVLYYRADSSRLVHDPDFDKAKAEYATTNPSIYNFDDNYAITGLGCPWDADETVNPHPMFTNVKVFYKAITNTKIAATPRPHNEDTFILLSAGYDGLYGTQDDVYNFAE